MPWSISSCGPSILTFFDQLRQGLRVKSMWAPALRSSVRAVKQQGWLHVFANSLTLGARIQDLRIASEGGGLAEGMVACALSRVAQRCPLASGLSAVDAASTLGYEDVQRVGNFWLREGGGGEVVKIPVPHTTGDVPPSNWKRVPYNALQAFPAGAERGWGLRSSVTIAPFTVVGEMIGRCLSEEEYEQLSDRTYVIGFDDSTLELKRRMKDPIRFIDCREYGNLMRLLNDCSEVRLQQYSCATARRTRTYALAAAGSPHDLDAQCTFFLVLAGTQLPPGLLSRA